MSGELWFSELWISENKHFRNICLENELLVFWHIPNYPAVKGTQMTNDSYWDNEKFKIFRDNWCALLEQGR